VDSETALFSFLSCLEALFVFLSISSNRPAPNSQFFEEALPPGGSYTPVLIFALGARRARSGSVLVFPFFACDSVHAPFPLLFSLQNDPSF